MPDPDSYTALRLTPPAASVPSSSRGAPVTFTAASKSTLTRIVSPSPYTPVPFGDETDSTPVCVSIAMALEPPSESGEPGGGRRALAWMPVPTSVIEPPGPARRACTPA